jgi:hypothetical protein
VVLRRSKQAWRERQLVTEPGGIPHRLLDDDAFVPHERDPDDPTVDAPAP